MSTLSLNTRQKRIMREIALALKQKDTENCSIGLKDPDDIETLQAKILGPVDTPYEGGIFELSITFPKAYPLVPPTVIFLTKIFHPNINDLGQICLNILGDSWVPSLSLIKVLLSICVLLCKPNPYDPINPNASYLLLNNVTEYNKQVKYYTHTYAY
jgi:ubiquitin-conjugating enzyme E2 D